jgi:hypothetical protein
LSIDTADFAHVTTTAQAGNQHPSFWPIVIHPTGWQLLSEHEININPCDAIWMPTLYDVALGANPAQPYFTTGVASPTSAYFLPNPGVTALPPGANFSTVVGSNMTDVYQNGYRVQAAPLFSLRINSPNNPWLLFGLATELATPYTGQLEQWWPAGQGGCMRSISGPISRLWIKFYRFAYRQTLPTTPGQSQGGGGVTGDEYSTIVLMSSLGYAQQTIERVQTRDDQGPTPLVAAWQQTIVSGGYQTPQLNTADRRSLERL